MIKKRFVKITLLLIIFLCVSNFIFAAEDKLKEAEEYLQKGLNYIENNQDQQAIEQIKKALEINPDFAEAYSGLGVVYDHLGQEVESIKNLKKAKELFQSQNNNLGVQKMDEYINAKIGANESIARATLAALNYGAGEYVRKKNAYPLNEKEIINLARENGLLYDSYNNKTIEGYTYYLQLNSDNYEITAKPELCGITGNTILVRKSNEWETSKYPCK